MEPSNVEIITHFLRSLDRVPKVTIPNPCKPFGFPLGVNCVWYTSGSGSAQTFLNVVRGWVLSLLSTIITPSLKFCQGRLSQSDLVLVTVESG